MSNRDDKCFLCSLCGKIDDNPPYECPRDGELDTTFDSDDYEIEDGTLYWPGWCDEAEDTVLLSKHEFFIDAANTASFLRRWAESQGFRDIEIEWSQREDGNGRWVDCVTFLAGVGGYDWHVLGRYYTECQERLKKLYLGEAS